MALGDDLLNTTPQLGGRELHVLVFKLKCKSHSVSGSPAIYISLSISMYLPMYCNYLDPGLLKDGSDSTGHDVVGVRGEAVGGVNGSSPPSSCRNMGSC